MGEKRNRSRLWDVSRLLSLSIFLAGCSSSNAGPPASIVLEQSVNNCELSCLRNYLSDTQTAGGDNLIYLAEVVSTGEREFKVKIGRVILDHGFERRGKKRLPPLEGKEVIFDYFGSQKRFAVGDRRYFLIEKGGAGWGNYGLLTGPADQCSVLPECFFEADRLISEYRARFGLTGRE